jgi:predicted GTPase
MNKIPHGSMSCVNNNLNTQSLIRWVTKNVSSQSPPYFKGHVKSLFPTEFAVVNIQSYLGWKQKNFDSTQRYFIVYLYNTLNK